MRICSLLPSATEIVYALGLGDQLVGVSHTCDYPADARNKPVVSRSVRSVSHLDSREIDSIIRQARDNNNPVHWIDGDLLRELRPDLIITQEICEVCAIDQSSVYATAARFLDYEPENRRYPPRGAGGNLPQYPHHRPPRARRAGTGGGTGVADEGTGAAGGRRHRES